MLGPTRSRDADRPVLVSLNELVPRDNFYRQLDRTLDLSFVRDWVKDCYAERARPSVDPIVFFKLQLTSSRPIRPRILPSRMPAAMTGLLRAGSKSGPCSAQMGPLPIAVTENRATSST